MGSLAYTGPDNPPVGNEIRNHIDVATGERLNPADIGDYEQVDYQYETGRGLPRHNHYMKRKDS